MYSVLGAERKQAAGDADVLSLKASVEETALAVEALLACWPNPGVRNATEGVPYSAGEGVPDSAGQGIRCSVEKGLNWLIRRVEVGEHRQPAPIGFYFAKLWYYERLYPLTFTVAALGRACRQFDCQSFAAAPDIPTETAPTDAQ